MNYIRKLNKALTLACVAMGLCWASNLQAQQDRPGRGNFDPEQMRQRMMERYREALEIKSDDEWKAIEPRITKVMDARREVGFPGGGFFGRGGPGGRRGGDGGPGGGAGGNDQGGGRPRGFGPEPSPEAEALQ